MPSFVHTAMAVDPSLIASMAYSTWKMRPSGLKLLTDLSYSLLVGGKGGACVQIA